MEATRPIVLSPEARAHAEVMAAAMAERLERMRKKNRNFSQEYIDFQRRYYYDPAGFVRDCFVWKETEGPTFYQERALAAIVKHKRVCIRGPHGLGKTAMLSWIILWFALTRDGKDWKIPTTASAWRQLSKFLWPEVHKWVRKLNWNVIGRAPLDERTELLSMGLKLSTGQSFAMASNKPELLEGAHAECLLYLYDEAKVIPDPTWDATEGAFTGNIHGEAYGVAASTPGPPVGRFYEIQTRKPGFEDWKALRVSLADLIRAGRATQAWADQRKKQWGEGSALYKNRVLGEFAASEVDGVIPLAWVEAANQRWLEWKDRWDAWWALGEGRAAMPEPIPTFTCSAADVGGGGDAGTRAFRYEWLIRNLESDHDPDTMVVADRLFGVWQGKGGYVVADIIGMGAGVVHRLRQLGAKVYGFGAAEKSIKRDISNEFGFGNLRAEAWWGLRERLDPANDPTLAFPPDDRLLGDLTAPRYRMGAGGKLLIESKEDLRKPDRLGRSPDSGDAVVMAFADPRSMEAPGAGILDFYKNQFQEMMKKKAAEAEAAK